MQAFSQGNYGIISFFHYIFGYNNDELELSDTQQQKTGKQSPGDIFPEYYLIKVNNFNDISKNTLDEWIYYLKPSNLPEKYTAQSLDLVEEELKYDKMSTKEKRQYNQYLKEVNLSKDMLETAKQKGKIDGKIEGKLERTVELIINGYEKGLNVSLLSNITGLSEEDILNLLKEHNCT